MPSCIRPEFKYTTAKELNSAPYTAKIDSYGGGGYVYHIKVLFSEIKKIWLFGLLPNFANNTIFLSVLIEIPFARITMP